MTERHYTNANITETVVVTDSLSGFTFGSLQADYPLTEAEFVRLSSESNWAKIAANSLFFVALGYGINFAPILFSGAGGEAKPPTGSEITVVCITFGITFLLYIFGLCLPNEKKKLMKKMGDHFERAPRSRHVMRDGK